MSDYLLDTHIAIFALLEPEKLSAAARDALLSGSSVLSVASYWEVAVKSMKGMLDVGDLRAW
jgi:PIN domain nuclease of toxin-antitoxin system